jgi:hypothetical protein
LFTISAAVVDDLSEQAVRCSPPPKSFVSLARTGHDPEEQVRGEVLASTRVSYSQIGR